MNRWVSKSETRTFEKAISRWSLEFESTKSIYAIISGLIITDHWILTDWVQFLSRFVLFFLISLFCTGRGDCPRHHSWNSIRLRQWCPTSWTSPNDSRIRSNSTTKRGSSWLVACGKKGLSRKSQVSYSFPIDSLLEETSSSRSSSLQVLYDLPSLCSIYCRPPISGSIHAPVLLKLRCNSQLSLHVSVSPPLHRTGSAQLIVSLHLQIIEISSSFRSEDPLRSRLLSWPNLDARTTENVLEASLRFQNDWATPPVVSPFRSTSSHLSLEEKV